MEDDTSKKVDETWKEKIKTEAKAGDPPETSEEPKADFKFFLSTLAMQAWISLGAMPNPATGQPEENVNQARFIIDTLDLLKEKTKGNLDKEEQDLFEQILYELRLGFVNKTMETEKKPHAGQTTP